MRAALKRMLGEALEKSGPAAVAVFVADGGSACRRMVEQLRNQTRGHPLVLIARPEVDRRSFPADVEWVAAEGAMPYAMVRRALRRRWVGLAPVMLDGEDRWQRLFWAFLSAPRRVVAFHSDGESHPLRIGWPIASWRFLRGERLGDIFRPTPFRWLRELARWMRAFALLAGWGFSRLRTRRTPPSVAEQSEERYAVIHLDQKDFFTRLDDAVYTENAAKIIVSAGARPPSADARSALLAYLSRPGVWMVAGRAGWHCPFGNRAVGARDRESGTYCLGSDSNLLALRRDVYLRMGGMAANGAAPSIGNLQALCLRALMRGWKTVYAGEIGEATEQSPGGEGADPPAISIAELLIAAVDAAGAALKALRLHGGNAEFRRNYWWAVRSVRPWPAAGKPSGKLFPLVTPGATVYLGRSAGRRPKIGVVTPYFPFPLSHGGAIRIYNLLRGVAPDFDIHLFAFAENETPADIEAMLEHCARIVLVKPPVWETPGWLTATPRGVRRYRVEQMRGYVDEFIKDFELSILQVEFTQLAFLGYWLKSDVSKILVEHDVTFELQRQAAASCQGWKRAAANAEAWRWRHFELSAMRHFDRVIAMSGGDRKLLTAHGVPEPKLGVIENGIDLDRFQVARPHADADSLLFIGSFRHYPNIRAYRLLAEEIWPRIIAARPGARLIVVAGPQPELYWRKHHAGGIPAPPVGVDLRAFVSDVRPLYEKSQVVAVPVPLSAGTNIKVLEALAMGRPVVTTTVGCAGLDLENGRHALIADGTAAFVSAVLRLFSDQALRDRLSREGRRHVEQRFGWPALATKQSQLWAELLRSQPRPSNLAESS